MKRQNEHADTDHFDAERRDRETITAVRHRIEHSRHKGLRRVKAKITEGTVTLTGSVPSEDDRDIALELVRSVKHIGSVIDEIEVVRA
jgi:osmotically-inducible protein OsmY